MASAQDKKVVIESCLMRLQTRRIELEQKLNDTVRNIEYCSIQLEQAEAKEAQELIERVKRLDEMRQAVRQRLLDAEMKAK